MLLLGRFLFIIPPFWENWGGFSRFLQKEVQFGRHRRENANNAPKAKKGAKKKRKVK
jgi:hypothetical protein